MSHGSFIAFRSICAALWALSICLFYIFFSLLLSFFRSFVCSRSSYNSGDIYANCVSALKLIVWLRRHNFFSRIRNALHVCRMRKNVYYLHCAQFTFTYLVVILMRFYIILPIFTFSFLYFLCIFFFFFFLSCAGWLAGRRTHAHTAHANVSYYDAFVV